jgi:hypothetical protein
MAVPEINRWMTRKNRTAAISRVMAVSPVAGTMIL